jgi:hypothetical protein
MKGTPRTGVERRDLSDDGAILMFVLVMLMFISLGVGPVLSVAFSDEVTTSVTAAADNGFYAADAGVEYAIQDLRGGLGSTCATAPPAAFLVPTTVDGPGITVTLSCVLVFPPGGTPLDTSSLLKATISSSVFTSTEKRFTATAVVAINMNAPNRNTSVESWSSVVS